MQRESLIAAVAETHLAYRCALNFLYAVTKLGEDNSRGYRLGEY